jgi:hypothetical protein
MTSIDAGFRERRTQMSLETLSPNEKRCPMNNTTDQNLQRVIEFAAVLVVIGMGMNIVVMQTLGSFDAAAVILGLFLGFWALVLGTGILMLSSAWFFVRKRHANLAEAHEVGHCRMCHC